MASSSVCCRRRTVCCIWTSPRMCYLYLIILGSLICGAYSGGDGCHKTKNAYKALGFQTNDVPTSMVSGEHLKICPQGFTCCTGDMEHELSTQSRQEYDKIMADKLAPLRNIFVSRTAKFDAFFTELLDNARRDLHEMFVRTYGLLYQQNAHVFTDLFKDLQNYYKGRDVNLMDALDGFFSTLLQKMFKLLNSQYVFDDSYMECVTDHMDDLKPFGTVPQKLSIQVKRAFIAARTFIQGLVVGREVVFATSKLQPTSSCGKALMKMNYCPYCRGLPDVRPCNNYCMNIMKGCLAYHTELDKEWNNYIAALIRLAERLEGPFNIESVVDPIDVKISDAIMNFQENTEVVSSKIIQGCGQPRLGKRKREAASNGDPYTINDNNNDKRRRGNGRNNKKSRGRKGGDTSPNTLHDIRVRPTTAAGTSLDRLVRDIKAKVNIAKDFWKQLPHAVCNQVAAPVHVEDKCWNGIAKSRYIPGVVDDGILAQNNNPEVDVDVRKTNVVINQQLLQLRLITSKLKNAYNGMDVDWIDTADTMGSGGGSGSGDQNDDDGSAMGSGYSPAGGHRMNSDDLGFVRRGTWQPPVVQTHRTPYQRDRSKDGYNNYNKEDNYNNYYQTNRSTVHKPTHTSLIATTLLLILTYCYSTAC